MIATHAIELDERGLLLTCPHCGKINRMDYSRLGQTFRCGQCHNDLPPPGEPVEVPNEAAFNALTTRAALPVLVEFYADWCGACKMVAPELPKVAAEGAGRWLIAKVNTDNVPGLAQQFDVTGIPLMVLFKGGAEVARQAGAMAASAIRQFIESRSRGGNT
ncbi:MAG: trxA 2 [Pedosphaera sp.]|nr:trxA 2 [Pedosphaera sp.]